MKVTTDGCLFGSLSPTLFKKEGVITTTYCTSSRNFIPAIEYSWAGLLRDDIGLPKNILDFANKFSTSRKEITELNITFLKAIR